MPLAQPTMTASNPAAPMATKSNSPKLSGSQWVLASINGTAPVKGGNNASINLYFSKDGKSAWGFSGVNTYAGTYSVMTPDRLTIQVSQTALTTDNKTILAQEKLYLKDLARSASFRLTNESLELYDASNQQLLTYQRRQEFGMNPEELVGTHWRLVSVNGQQVVEGLSITLIFESDNMISGQAGPWDYALSYEATGDNIAIRSAKVVLGTSVAPSENNGEALHALNIQWGGNYQLSKGLLEIIVATGDDLVYKP